MSKTHTQLATEAIGFPPSSAPLEPKKSAAPDLHTCPDCGQPNFTERGLKAHQGGITCLKRAAKLQPAATVQDPADLRAAEATACITRFRAFHEAAKGSVIALKTAKFFAGIEIQTLCDLHEEEYGETRGGDRAAKKEAPQKLEDFLEDQLGVTYRTAHRYRRHFLDCSQDHPELADKLRKWWLDWKDKAALELAAPAGRAVPKKGKATSSQLTTTAPQALALQGVCNLAAKDIETLLHQADEFGLHELFEKPMKDITPKPEPEPAPAAQGDKLAKFWLKDFCRRAMNNEFLKLRKQEKEALLTTLEEAAQKLKDSLAAKKK